MATVLSEKTGSKSVKVNGQPVRVDWSVARKVVAGSEMVSKRMYAEASELGMRGHYPHHFWVEEVLQDGSVRKTEWVAGYFNEAWDGEWLRYDSEGDVVSSLYCGQGAADGWVFEVFND